MRRAAGVGPRRWPSADTLLFLALGVWLFRGSLLLGGVFFKRDIHLVWLPQVEGIVRAVTSGSWPVWDPSPAFGQPLLADPSAMLLYPLTWLNLLVRPWTYYPLFAFAHFVFTAFGMRVLGRYLGLSREAALAAAIAWAASGPYLSLVDVTQHYAGAAWMPWVVWAALRAFAGGWRDVARFALVLGLQVAAGSADMCAMSLLVAAALGASRHLEPARVLSPESRAMVMRAVAGGLLALGLSAAMWMPALEVVSRAARAELPESVRTYWSLHPFAVAEIFLPRLLSALPLKPALQAAVFESREPFLTFLYLGVATLPLVGAALGTRHPLRRALALVLLLATLVALGIHTPVYGILTTLLPPLRILRYPVKAMTVVALAWALLAGLGVDAWRERPAGRRFALRVTLPLALVCAAALLLGLAARWAPEAMGARILQPNPDLPAARVLHPASDRLLVTVAFGATALAIALAGVKGRLAGGAAGAVLATLAALDLAYHHRSPSPMAPKALYTYRSPVATALGDPAFVRAYIYDYSIPGKVERHLGKQRLPYALARIPERWLPAPAQALGVQMYLGSETAGRYGISQAYGIDIRGLHPLPLTKLTKLLLDTEGTPAHGRLLEMAGVTHTVALHALSSLPARQVEGLFERPILVQRLEAPLPRTYVVGTARRVTDENALELFLDPGFDPRREILVAGGEASAGHDVHGTSRVTSAAADRLELEAELDAPGYVVILEGFDPGWRVRVDGRAAPLLRANVAFRAVAVPAGRHRIEMKYRPFGLRLGLAVSALAALVVGAAFRPRPPADPGRDGAGGEASPSP